MKTCQGLRVIRFLVSWFRGVFISSLLRPTISKLRFHRFGSVGFSFVLLCWVSYVVLENVCMEHRKNIKAVAVFSDEQKVMRVKNRG